MRTYCAECLGHFGEHAAKTVPELVALLADEDKFVRGSVIRSLGQIEREPKIVVPALVKYLTRQRKKADEEMNAIEAAIVLSRFGRDAHEALLVLEQWRDDLMDFEDRLEFGLAIEKIRQAK